MTRILFVILLFITFNFSVFCQNLTILNVDTSAYPIMKMDFIVTNPMGKQIKNMNISDFELIENGEKKVLSHLICKPDIPPRDVSIALSLDVSGSMYSKIGNSLSIDLAKETAKTLVNTIELSPSDFALQTCHSIADIITDFTEDKELLLTKIDEISAIGGNDFTEHLLNQHTGLLNIAKTGKNKRVAIIYTDGWYRQLSNEDLAKCMDICNFYDIQFHAIIYSSSDIEPNGIKRSLKQLCDYTGGMFFDGIIGKEAAINIAYHLQQRIQSHTPCTISWDGGKCNLFKYDVQLKYNPLNVSDSKLYTPAQRYLLKVKFNKQTTHFVDPEPNILMEKSITIQSVGTIVDVSKILSSDPNFKVTPDKFYLLPGESTDLKISYLPKNQNFKNVTLTFVNNDCNFTYKVYARHKDFPKEDIPLELTHPNGNEVFIAGTDTVITWDGIDPNQRVKLEYRINDTSPWVTIADNIYGNIYNFKVPTAESDKYLARVILLDPPMNEEDFVVIYPGKFLKGNTGKFIDTFITVNEFPVHEVTLTKTIYMSKYEVTEKLFRKITGRVDQYSKGLNHPAVNLTLHEALKFCNALSEWEGFEPCYIFSWDSGRTDWQVVCNFEANGYRLPLEAEWEYACKAGTTTDLYNGNLINLTCNPIDNNLAKIAWYKCNSNYSAEEVGKKQPNALGLYDMLGNANEWTWSPYVKYTKEPITNPYTPSVVIPGGFVTKGSDNYGEAGYVRSSARKPFYVMDENWVLGFRIVRNID